MLALAVRAVDVRTDAKDVGAAMHLLRCFALEFIVRAAAGWAASSDTASILALTAPQGWTSAPWSSRFRVYGFRCLGFN